MTAEDRSSSKLDGYAARRDFLESAFPSAYRFLRFLEFLRLSDRRFDIGTQQNLQLYRGDKFLFHLTLPDAKTSRPKIIFSPTPHLATKRGKKTLPAHHLSQGMQSILQSIDEEHPWIRRGSGGVWYVDSSTPERFFELLKEWLING